MNSTNTALGQVTIATQYNVYESEYDNLAAMQASQFNTSCKPCESMLHPIECDPAQTPLPLMYVRAGTAPTGADLRMYDLCRTTIATSGVQGTSVNLGQLWVTYHVTLYKPKLYASLGYAADFARYVNHTISLANPYGTLSQSRVDGAFTLAGSTNNLTLTFPSYPNPAVYSVFYYCDGNGTPAAITHPTIAVSSGVTKVNSLALSDFAS